MLQGEPPNGALKLSKTIWASRSMCFVEFEDVHMAVADILRQLTPRSSLPC